jgi:hypothetical protein
MSQFEEKNVSRKRENKHVPDKSDIGGEKAEEVKSGSLHPGILAH